MAQPKQPQDHRNADTFTYSFEFGDVVFPKFKKVMTFGKARELRTVSEEDKVILLIEEFAKPADLKKMDALDGDAIGDFIAAWQKDSGVDMGESPAS